MYQLSTIATHDITVAGFDGDYNPSKSRYDPVKDACWPRGKPVPYRALSNTLSLIEATSKRLEIIAILRNFFRFVFTLMRVVIDSLDVHASCHGSVLLDHHSSRIAALTF